MRTDGETRAFFILVDGEEKKVMRRRGEQFLIRIFQTDERRGQSRNPLVFHSVRLEEMPSTFEFGFVHQSEN